MDSSPEPTVIVRALKDFDQFLSTGSKSREILQGSSRRLNYSDDVCRSTFLEESRANLGLSSRKRQLDSLVGFDVTKKFREKESEVINTRAEVARLEGRLRETELQHKKGQLERNMELECHRARQRRDKEMIDDLQHKFRKALGRVREVEEVMEQTSAKTSATTLDTQAKMVKMQHDLLQQSDQLRQEVEGLRERVLTLEKEVKEKDTKVVLAESQVGELEEELKVARRKVLEALTSQQNVDTLQLKLDQVQAKLKELEARQEGLSEAEERALVFEATVRKLPPLERELAKLKQDNKFHRDVAMNSQLLEEKVMGAQQQIGKLEQRCKDMATLQAQLDASQALVAKFEALGQELELNRVPTPEDLHTQLEKLQRGDQMLNDDLNQLRENLRSHKETCNAAEKEVQRLRTRLEREQRSTIHNGQLVKRLQRKLLIVTKERDGLKSVLTSYKAEVTINHSTVSQERTHRLEELLSLYRDELKRLEDELGAAGQDNKTLPAPQARRSQDIEKMNKLQEKLKEKEDQMKELECQAKEREGKVKELEERVREKEERVKLLEGEKGVLELRLETRALKGDYDPTKTKVLHFKNNPLARAVEGRETELERLCGENEKLQERVRLLEAGDSHDLTQRVGLNLAHSSHNTKELTDLQEKVSSLESRNKRMMEAFKRKSLEMREVVYRLTGYRVDTSGNNQYKLIPMYAESPDDFLLFEQTESKELQFLETDFSIGLEDLIDAYLRHENSYPAFLSAVTLDLFNHQAGFPSSSSTQEEEEEEVGEELQEEEEEEEDDQDGEVQEVVMETDGKNSREAQQEEDDDDDLIMLD